MSTPLDSSGHFSPHRRWGMAAAIAAGLLLAYPLRYALIPFAIAGGLAFVATPGVEWLSRRLRLRRWVAATVVFIAFLAVLAGLGWWVKSVVFPDAMELTQSLPQMTRQLFVSAAGSDRARLLGHDISADAVMAEADAAARGLVEGEGGIARMLATGLGALLLSVLTLSTLCYFLISGPALYRGVVWLFPPWLRPHVEGIAAQMGPFIFRYVVGMIVVISATCVLSWIGLGPLLRMPHAIVLALVVGLLEFFPVVGAVLSALLLGLAAVAQGSIGTVIGVAAFTLILRLLIDQLVAPIIYGKASALHPAAVLFAFLVGATLYGMLGLLLAVPVAATIKVVLMRCYCAPSVSGPGTVENETDGNGTRQDHVIDTA